MNNFKYTELLYRFLKFRPGNKLTLQVFKNIISYTIYYRFITVALCIIYIMTVLKYSGYYSV